MSPVTRHPSHFLPFAHALADAAGDIIRPYFGAHGEVEEKGDNSPVTHADRAAEQAMRARISASYPDHSIYGEEFGASGGAGSASPLGGEATRLNEQSEFSRSGEGMRSVALNATHPHPTLSPKRERASPASPPELSPERPTSPPLTQPSPQGERASPAAPPESSPHPPASSPHYTWVLDPIDGTRAFIAGRKEWGTLIALCENGVPILGILDQPVTGERWVGISGQPTTYTVTPSNDGVHLGRAKKDRPRHKDGVTHCCKTRPCPSLADAELSTTSAHYFTPTQAKQVVALAQQCRASAGGDCYAYGLLARGMRDIVVDAGLKPYDILALVPIIEGAGGRITTWDGAAVTLENYRDVVAVGDGGILEQLNKKLVSF